MSAVVRRPREGDFPQQLQWREGIFQYRADADYVIGVTNLAAARRSSGDRAVSKTELGARLSREHPGVRIVRRPAQYDDFAVYGFHVPWPVGGLGIAAALGALVLLIEGPEPWWATRWAWFWLLPIPLALPAFLLLSGPIPLLPSPRRPDRRLTGGWAFLLSALLTSEFSQRW